MITISCKLNSTEIIWESFIFIYVVLIYFFFLNCIANKCSMMSINTLGCLTSCHCSLSIFRRSYLIYLKCKLMSHCCS